MPLHSPPLATNCLSTNHHPSLLLPPFDVEIHTALNSFQPLKALGPDGFHPFFF